MVSSTQYSLATGVNPLSVAVLGPDEDRRKAVVRALQESDGGAGPVTERLAAGLTIEEFCSYPFELHESPKMLERRFDVVFIDLDSDTEYALEVVESLSASNAATVMVYSAQADRNLVIRCMRAGAREFLNLPLAPGDLPGALARLTVQDPAMRRAKGIGKRFFVFLGSKGGCGVTTIASSFAVSLAQESGQSTLLIDLGLPLGDAAIQLGMACNYSTVNALEDWLRLDGSFLNSLLAEHRSGLRVLAAPGEFPRSQAPMEAYDRLLAVARQNFQYVVVDIGARMDLKDSALFDESACQYLVTEVGISDLRNANRLITQPFSQRCHKLQIVLNRYAPHALGFDASDVAKVLTRPVDWKIPDEDRAGRVAAHAAGRVADQIAPIAQAARQMARAACGLPAAGEREKKKAFSLFR
jgi:pilus assembly protein CpaE